MAKGNFNIKDLTNSLRDNKQVGINTDTVVNNDKTSADDIAAQNKDNKVLTDQATNKPEVPKAEKPEKKPAEKKADNLKAISSQEVNDIAFFIKQVNGWERAKGAGSTPVQIDEKFNAFLAQVRVATGIRAVQLVNYLLMDFFKSNPEFIKYVKEKASSNLLDDEVQNE